MRLTLAQINPTIGDIEGNLSLMTRAARSAFDQRSDVVVFPELSLTGYYPADLLDEEEFQRRLAAGTEALRRATKETPGLNWVVGAPTRNAGRGKPLHNSLLVLRNGKVGLEYHKQLLPTYNIFDEARHFEPGPDTARVMRIGDARVGFLVCEDGWNDQGADYAVNPFQRVADAAPDVVLSINASPSNIGKREQRHQVFSQACARHNLPLAYVNQVGGHDSLVYDGASFLVTPGGGVVYEAERFTEFVSTVVFDPVAQSFKDTRSRDLQAPLRLGLSTLEFYRRQIVLGLRDYARRCGFKKVVVGCSGGIDSALTLALAVEALGADNVLAITMPSQFSSKDSVSDSVVLCENLGIRLIEHPIGDIVASYQAKYRLSTGEELQGIALENLQARVRGTVLMEFSNAHGYLLLTTGNKSEISVGFCTLYGDTNGGLGLIGDLYKTEVFDLAAYLNEAAGRVLIPRSILVKEPTADLAPGQKDSDRLPPYPLLDAILKVYIEGKLLAPWEWEKASRTVDGLRQTDTGQALIRDVRGLIARNEYKRRQAPPNIRVRARAFGSGRQVPIAARHF